MDTEIKIEKLYSVGNLFRDSFSIIRKNIKFFSVFAVVLIALNIIADSIAPVIKYQEHTNQSFILSLLFTEYKNLPSLLINGVISAIPTIALIFAIDNLSDRKPVTVEGAFAKGLEKFVPYLWVYIFMMFFIEAGFVFLFIPGIIISLWLMFSTIVLVLEDKQGLSALARSRQLVRGNLSYVFGVSLGCGLIYLAMIGIPLWLLWAILHFVVRLPGDYVGHFISVGSGVGSIPAFVIYILIFKNLRKIKGDRIIAISPD